MISTLDKPVDQLSEKILCWYINITSKVQVIRISNIPNWYFERTVFPGERFIFESFSQAELEIYQKDQNNTIFCQQRLCCELEVEEDKDS
jgi:hypothetical protein